MRTTKYSIIFATTRHMRVVNVGINIQKTKTKKSEISKVILNWEGLLKLQRRLIKFWGQVLRSGPIRMWIHIKCLTCAHMITTGLMYKSTKPKPFPI